MPSLAQQVHEDNVETEPALSERDEDEGSEHEEDIAAVRLGEDQRKALRDRSTRVRYPIISQRRGTGGLFAIC
ncbi:hypothetical protein BC936DRAFT_147977 [Jimgerdemannia flammicorona]|uniref:Uncharacterized protein n=1 Tax=Jimgerdemannia flammicorona TaxID=994334 RepID=A0A433DKZ3_9FUNG|nr:hypothetical protein BC936DRAFT_147977 [Jimgerdemannia flammicorona]